MVTGVMTGNWNVRFMRQTPEGFIGEIVSESTTVNTIEVNQQKNGILFIDSAQGQTIYNTTGGIIFLDGSVNVGKLMKTRAPLPSTYEYDVYYIYDDFTVTQV